MVEKNIFNDYLSFQNGCLPILKCYANYFKIDCIPRLVYLKLFVTFSILSKMG